MHEIVTLQFGKQSNYLGTHFWNTQVRTMPQYGLQHPSAQILDKSGCFGCMLIVQLCSHAKRVNAHFDLATTVLPLCNALTDRQSFIGNEPSKMILTC
jgi:hypothetical protein